MGGYAWAFSSLLLLWGQNAAIIVRVVRRSSVRPALKALRQSDYKHRNQRIHGAVRRCCDCLEIQLSPLQFQAELTKRLGRPVSVYQNGVGCIVQLADVSTEYAGPAFLLTIETLVAVELALADILVQSQAVTVH